jgi:hypothetical protein
MPSAALVPIRRNCLAGPAQHGCNTEVTMLDPSRRVRLLRELEQESVPDYDAQNALEHIAFRIARIEHNLGRIATALEAVLPRARR